MSKNKQSIKLYTEEQIIDIFEKYVNMSAINARNILDLSESIQLPSDEEIHKQAINYSGFDNEFKAGAKWMRDKIQRGNNEQQ